MSKTPITQRGADLLKAELKRLKSEDRPRVIAAIAEAREHGDLKENAEYHAQREAQGMLQAKINQLKSQLANASIVDPSKIKTDEIAFGAKVTVKDLDYDDEEQFTFVGSGDEDYDAGKYLITSPMGQGLLGKKVGDKVEIPVPKGTLKFEVLKIEYDL